MAKTIRAAIYLRVSTGEQTVENQRRDLHAVAEQRGWSIVAEYADEGISGAKGRDKRPSLDRMLKDATRGRIDVVMVWSVDRLGRSLPDLVASMQDLNAAKVDLFLAQQGLDTTTPSGRAMFGMLGVFADFERSMIQARVKSGMARAKASGKHCGRPRTDDAVEAAIRADLAEKMSFAAITRKHGVGAGTIMRIKAATLAA